LNEYVNEGDCQSRVGSNFNYFKTGDCVPTQIGRHILDTGSVKKLLVKKSFILSNERSIRESYREGYVTPPYITDHYTRFGLDGFNNSLQSYSYSKYSVMYICQWRLRRYSLSIKDYNDVSLYENCFSDSFKESLNAVRAGTETPENLIELYGTHIVALVEYGQSIDYSLKFFTDDDDKSEFYKLASDAERNGIYNSEYVKKYGNSYKFLFTSTGDWLRSATLKRLFDDGEGVPEEYDDAANVCIGFGVNDRGIVPVWEILPAEYKDVADMIKAEYDKQYEALENREKEAESSRREKDEEARKHYAKIEAEKKASSNSGSSSVDSSGCKSVILSSGLLFMLSCLLAVFVVAKKMRDNL